MIIKSMSRKTSSFSSLVNYLCKEKSKTFTWNMYSSKDNKQKIIREFMENAKYLKNSRGKVYLYHEVISLKNENLDNKLSQKILQDLANEYISLRAKNHLVFASIHFDTKNPHIHLAISSNEVCGTKRKRLSKKEFSNIQAYIESYKNEKYKSLENSKIYGKSKVNSKEKQAEQELKKRRNKSSIKDMIKRDLSEIFSFANTKTNLQNALKLKHYELYQRGKTNGIIFEDKKYRLKTLGLDEIYENSLKKIEEYELKQTKIQNSKTNSRDKLRKPEKTKNRGFSRWKKKKQIWYIKNRRKTYNRNF